MEIVGCLRRDFSLNNFSSYRKKENAFSCLLTSLMLFVILKDLGSITWHEGITCIKTENLVLKNLKKKKKSFSFLFSILSTQDERKLFLRGNISSFGRHF